MSRRSSSSTPSTPKFKPGQRVEIRSDDPGFRGPWYSGIVLRRDKSNPSHYSVQYEKLYEDESERDPLQQTLDYGRLRPAPPPVDKKKISFKFGDPVDAYQSDCWWEGTIASRRPDGKFVVSFGGLKEQAVFVEKDLRVRMDWIDGKWELPFEQRSVEETETSPISVMKLQKSDHVMVSSSSGGESIRVAKGKRLSVSEEHSQYSEYPTINVVKERSSERTETSSYKVIRCTESDHVRINTASSDGGESLKFAKEKKFSASAGHARKKRSAEKTETRANKVTRSTEFLQFDAKEKKYFTASAEQSNHSEFPTTKKKKNVNGDVKAMKFGPGMEVEVTSHDQGLKGSWYLAKIIGPSGKDEYLVEYKTLLNEDQTEFLREDVRTEFIRPCQPDFVIVDGFKIMDQVDAYHNEGWWAGFVIKTKADCKYTVYFKESLEEMVFGEAYLRPHHDWVNGQWIVPSKAEKQ
ncbi:Protein AGENET DOMAIN (AGD)-CONTAINING P1 [Linum grandiflorum]